MQNKTNVNYQEPDLACHISHKIELVAAKHGKATMFYNGFVIGLSNQPLFYAARWLLKHGKADARDTIETYRGPTMSMRAKVGDAAKLTVVEDDYGLRFSKHRPPPSSWQGSDQETLEAACRT